MNVVNTTELAASDTSAAAVAVVPPASNGAAGLVAALNSVQQVQRDYVFNPERYTESFTDSGSFWSVSSSIPIQIQRLWGKMEASTASQLLGHYIFNNVRRQKLYQEAQTRSLGGNNYLTRRQKLNIITGRQKLHH